MCLCFITTLTTLILTAFSFVPNYFVAAQTLPCGNIIAPLNWDSYFNPDAALQTKSVSDCLNPFSAQPISNSVYRFLVDGNVVASGDALAVPGGTTDQYAIDTKNQQVKSILFRHDGNDYRYVDKEELDMVEADYRLMASQFFPEGTDIEPFIAAYLSPNPYTYFSTSDPKWRQLINFDDYIYNNWIPKRPVLVSGTYTLVFREYQVFPTQKTLLQKFASLLIPTASAYGGTGVYSITFTIAPATPAPTGASSVLFLPGIMGSRLSEDTDVCGNGSGETELWVSISDCKQLRLATTFTGASINNLYTKSSNNSVIDESYGANLYKTFISSLSDWKSTGIIKDYKLVGYDWRLRLDDLLKAKLDVSTGRITYNPSNTMQEGYLYKTLQTLVASSTTGKVTIVAHSNGGLLAKALLANLKIINDPLLSKIDNLILVASPQLGTPNTLLGLLHGDIIGPFGSVVSQQTTRTLMNTMPFAYHLLPSSNYFSGTGVTVNTPVINFETGTATSPWATTFGTSITTVPALQTFLSTQSGRTKPAVSDLANPEVLNTFLFSYSSTIHQLMNNWVPPDTMKVYQIAGIGIPTMTGITYFTDKECATRSFPNIFKCATYKAKIGMRPNESIDGDETVVVPSALGMSDSQSNVKRLWLNLDAYNTAGIGGSENFNRRHKDIFEVQDVINFVKNTIEATTTAPYLYLTNSVPTLPIEDRLVFDLHSPLDLSIITADGGVISSSSVTVEGAQYKRFGEMQHISMLQSALKKTVKLAGTGTGSFTLEIGEKQGAAITKRHTYAAIPSSTSTKITIDLETAKPIEEALVIVDYDGNGTPDISYNTAGEVALEITYRTLNTAINNLSINSLYKKLLLENAKIAEQYQIKSITQSKYKPLERLALNVLKQQVILYEKLKILTPTKK